MKESGAHAVKLEGGAEVLDSVERILHRPGIPVMGHLGLTPQSIYKFGTYVVRAREEEEAERLKRDATSIARGRLLRFGGGEDPCQPWQLAVATSLSIPVIGIGAGGNGVDGQVLVMHDMLGITHEFNPRFLRRYAELHDRGHRCRAALRGQDVRSSDFPGPHEQY
jgi:3-methyl-2-oxobutanoate hydroxymethyltransferase